MTDRLKKQSSSNLNTSNSGNNQESPDVNHKLKMSIDIQSTKDMQLAFNLICQYKLRLGSAVRTFRSEQATPVSQGAGETKVNAGFASYEFNASKT